MKINKYVRWPALGIYAFCVYIIYLIGTIYAEYIFILFVVMLLYPILSLILLIISYMTIRYSQNFSTDHPIKGKGVDYTILITNPSLFPIAHVNIVFRSVTPSGETKLPNLNFFIMPFGSFKKTFEIKCPYRGIYMVGFEELMIEDLLHFFRIPLKIWHQTFYVYPQVLELQYISAGLEEIRGGDKGLPFGGEPDYAMFDQLKEYRDGESIRHIYWKKTAIIGKPMLKQFDATPDPAVHIYFDLRKPIEKYISELEIEDVSVEILTSLTNFFLRHSINTTVKAPGSEYFNFTGKNPTDFGEFYNLTANLVFQDTISLAKLFRSVAIRKDLNSNAVFFVTHILDLELFTMIQASLESNMIFTVIFNQCGFDSEGKAKNIDYFNSLRNQGARIIAVEGTATIIEDLQREHRG